MAWSERWAGSSADAYVDRVGQLAELGITWTTVGIDTSSFAAAIDDLRAWGAVRRSVAL